jgi:hypothetical protein
MKDIFFKKLIEIYYLIQDFIKTFLMEWNNLVHKSFILRREKILLKCMTILRIHGVTYP